ncbi:MAG: hypothetical protein MR215_05120 [Bacteroidales bacterium]|nr:hypothetical protein [Bacteroidales bacterium]MDD7725840.1 hypothetical protein [Bacteroidales bacterium]MDY4175468.1 hypothetical protein [Bacteroidales bacterium]
MKIKNILATLSLLLVSLAASAQDEEYFNNSWWNCELSGRQTVWNIKSYRSGLSFINTTERASGQITFSDDCIEFNYPEFQMHFPVDAYKRISDGMFCVTRNGEDDYFDYIEVIRQGQKAGCSYRLMIAKLDPDGTMQNTRIFTCVPQRLMKGKNLKEALDDKSQGFGLPPQVPAK